ncbi:MAG: RAD55 family ATPase [Halodesulfurarchaeum sp.]
MSYELDGALPPDVLSDIDPGTNVLVSGPPMSGKRELMLRILARGATAGDGSVVVTTGDPAGDITAELDDYLETDTSFFRVIDCVSSQGGGSVETDSVRSVSSPGDLTGIGIEFSEIASEAESSGVDRLRIAFDSVSPLLMYVDLQRLFRFLHVFTSQIQSRGWLGLFAIDPETHDEQSVNTISQLFDGMIEIRLQDEGGREVRTRGFTGSSTEWVALE